MQGHHCTHKQEEIDSEDEEDMFNGSVRSLIQIVTYQMKNIVKNIYRTPMPLIVTVTVILRVNQ